MACLQAADHGIEQVAAAVGEQPSAPRWRDLEPDVEPSLAGHERPENGPSVGGTRGRLVRCGVALIGRAADLPRREPRIRLQSDAVFGCDSFVAAGGTVPVCGKHEPRIEHPRDARVHHPGDRWVGPTHRGA